MSARDQTPPPAPDDSDARARQACEDIRQHLSRAHRVMDKYRDMLSEPAPARRRSRRS